MEFLLENSGLTCEINFFSSHSVSGNNDAEEESDEDEDYVPSEDWKKVCNNIFFLNMRDFR